MAEATKVDSSGETATVRLPKEMVRKAGIITQASGGSIMTLLTEIIGDEVDRRFNAVVGDLQAEVANKGK